MDTTIILCTNQPIKSGHLNSDIFVYTVIGMASQYQTCHMYTVIVLHHLTSHIPYGTKIS